MIIIIDGPDLSGKTYAIEKISKHFNSGFVLKNAYKPKTKVDSNKIYAQYWKILNLILSSNSNDLIILDRLFPSQAVYSYLRGVDEFYLNEIWVLDNYCADKKILFVYLDTPLKVLNERYDKRGDEHVKKEMLTRLKLRYDDFYEQTSMTKYKLNTLEDGWLEKFEKWVKENAQIK